MRRRVRIRRSDGRRRGSRAPAAVRAAAGRGPAARGAARSRLTAMPLRRQGFDVAFLGAVQAAFRHLLGFDDRRRRCGASDSRARMGRRISPAQRPFDGEAQASTRASRHATSSSRSRATGSVAITTAQPHSSGRLWTVSKAATASLPRRLTRAEADTSTSAPRLSGASGIGSDRLRRGGVVRRPGGRGVGRSRLAGCGRGAWLCPDDGIQRRGERRSLGGSLQHLQRLARLIGGDRLNAPAGSACRLGRASARGPGAATREARVRPGRRTVQQEGHVSCGERTRIAPAWSTKFDAERCTRRVGGISTKSLHALMSRHACVSRRS